LGWRAVFLIGAGLTAAFAVLLHRRLPVLAPPQRISYVASLRSLWTLARREPVLREAAAISFMIFAAFSAFWTSLAFYLGSPVFRLGPGVAGAFGLVGAAGALAAAPVGRLADRRGPRLPLTLSLVLLCAGYATLWIFGRSLIGLVAGVIVLDVGQQTSQIANQTRIFALSQTARSRVNTVYMIVFFLGGALGSELSVIAWSRWQWNGVCGLALTLLALAWLLLILGMRGALGRRAAACRGAKA
jgi:predicted MFS family arabinose efflux permease